MRLDNEFLIRAALCVGVCLIAILVMMAQNSGAKNYLERRGYEVHTFKTQVFQTNCTLSKDRRKFNFTATRDGQPVRGYLCYGGLPEAKIHEEVTQ